MFVAGALLALTPFAVALGIEGSSPEEGPAYLAHLTLEQLANVKVTTYSKMPTDLWSTPAAIYVITSEQILRSGA
ncbi:MAG TPA: hypothetical protein VN579_06730, partial [Bryobacteraceae bacterium]|nr:hypothetical protein [Bryobacteraceae bacterium]